MDYLNLVGISNSGWQCSWCREAPFQHFQAKVSASWWVAFPWFRMSVCELLCRCEKSSLRHLGRLLFLPWNSLPLSFSVYGFDWFCSFATYGIVVTLSQSDVTLSQSDDKFQCRRPGKIHPTDSDQVGNESLFGSQQTATSASGWQWRLSCGKWYVRGYRAYTSESAFVAQDHHHKNV